MSALPHYTTQYRRQAVSSVTDVQSFIDAVKDEVLVQHVVGSRWSDLGSNKLKTPPDLAGRFATVELSRVSQTVLGFHVRNHLEQTIKDGRAQIAGSASGRIFSGDYHLFLELESAGPAFEKLCMSLLDPRPEALGVHPFYVIAKTQRNNAGGLESNRVDWRFWFAKDMDLTISDQNRGGAISSIGGTSTDDYLTMTGTDIETALSIGVTPGFNLWRHAGYAFQIKLVNADWSGGQVNPLPLEPGVTGNFEVLNGFSALSGIKPSIRVP